MAWRFFRKAVGVQPKAVDKSEPQKVEELPEPVGVEDLDATRILQPKALGRIGLLDFEGRRKAYEAFKNLPAEQKVKVVDAVLDRLMTGTSRRRGPLNLSGRLPTC